MSTLRIIAGRWRGRTIKAPAGNVTRPTTDRVREAWASTVASLLGDEGFEGIRVLDPFAGSGGLGLEALSRGAAHAVFCERDHRIMRLLRENVAGLEGAASLSTLLAIDSLTARGGELLGQQGPFNLVVLDPPYACLANRIAVLLHGLLTAGALAPQALISYEHRADVSSDALAACLAGHTPLVDHSPAVFQMVSCKTYGSTQITYLCFEGES
jgi:16S rRNA (guanine966-N2)-methyltransferase